MEIKFSKISENSLSNIYDYIFLHNPKAAKKAVQQIFNSIQLIKKNPHIGVNGRVKNTREFFIPTSNYFIVYTLTNKTLYIVNIIHTARSY
ncbi:type II toxin-antitoxin system RelE/ParE family toxin [Candidatus Hepatincola sp. Pdp]